MSIAPSRTNSQRDRLMTGTKPIKHPVTPEMDAVIRRVYRTEGTGSGEVWVRQRHTFALLPTRDLQ